MWYKDDRAFIVYFTHPFGGADGTRSVIQMAEMKLVDGKLVCDRNAEFDTNWK